MSAIFLPIHPKHVNNIVNGFKTIEFRKKEFTKKIERMVVYSTYPVKRAVCIVDVKRVEKVPVWKLFTSEYREAIKSGCVCKTGLKDYYKGCSDAILIHIEEVRRFEQSVYISDLPFRVPQLFRYLSGPEYIFFFKLLK